MTGTDIMVWILAIAGIVGTGGWGAIIAIPGLLYYYKERYREELIRNSTPEDLDNPMIRLLLGRLNPTPKEMRETEDYKRRVGSWR